jgi:peroxiredoxin
LLPDTGRNLSILYTAATNPDQLSDRMSVLIDKDGNVRLLDRAVNVRSHGPDILAKMKEIKFDKPYWQTLTPP